MEKEIKPMKNINNSNIMKNVRGGIVALLGCLDGRFQLERGASFYANCNLPKRAPWGFESPTPLHT